MITIDQEHNRQVRQRFSDKCLSLQKKITTLQSYNMQLSNKLTSLIEERNLLLKRVLRLADQQAFNRLTK